MIGAESHKQPVNYLTHCVLCGGFKGGPPRGHRPALLLYLCWSHANIMCLFALKARISNSILCIIIINYSDVLHSGPLCR